MLSTFVIVALHNSYLFCLLGLFHGDVNSVSVVKEVLLEFNNFRGLMSMMREWVDLF